ncbi:hypothetical protein, partial [Bacteroides pyogenes]|uniref:hypothetical protein n=1 Tax=Bacteroides pyogenes TaxID=310300 RepID=UPI001BA51715
PMPPFGKSGSALFSVRGLCAGSCKKEFRNKSCFLFAILEDSYYICDVKILAVSTGSGNSSIKSGKPRTLRSPMAGHNSFGKL